MVVPSTLACTPSPVIDRKSEADDTWMSLAAACSTMARTSGCSLSASTAASEAASGAHDRDHAEPGHHETPDGSSAATVAQPEKLDNDLYMRDYSKCILCYKCVEACGDDAATR